MLKKIPVKENWNACPGKAHRSRCCIIQSTIQILKTFNGAWDLDLHCDLFHLSDVMREILRGSLIYVTEG